MTDKRNDPGLRYGVLRRTQSVVPFGVGSILDLPNESLMPLSIDFWPLNMGTAIYEDRLQKRLGVSHFRMAPSEEEMPDDGLPCIRFPKWLFCPKCRFLRPIDVWCRRYETRHRRKFSIPQCDTCGVKLVPSRFVVACERGHIDDFPWCEWTHAGNLQCSDPDLTIHTGGSSSGLIGIKVQCKSCGAQANMAGAFSESAHDKRKCSGNMPWLGKHEQCDSVLRTLQRGASNIYFPQAINSIEIPSYSDNLRKRIRSTSGWRFLLDLKEPDNATVGVIVRTISEQLGHNTVDVQIAVNEMLKSHAGEPVTCSEIDYRYDEYRVFQGVLGEDELASENFELEVINGLHYDTKGIESVALLHRLREVRALVAFSRIHPLDRHETPAEGKETRGTQPVSAKRGRRKNWLPAVEIKGEGIFIKFDEHELDRWGRDLLVLKRAEILNSNFENMTKERGFSPRTITPKFVLLHTLAHLLIRQLSFECGYGSASLRERIYCNETSDQPHMAGILIYTANGDADGTLGGLVRQGKPDFLPSLVRKAVLAGRWCSSDPLCIESQGQGLGSLNLAACHACALLPETSCEEFNRLLDRALVVGLPDNPNLGFFSSMFDPHGDR
jgi:hypothetical protein